MRQILGVYSAPRPHWVGERSSNRSVASGRNSLGSGPRCASRPSACQRQIKSLNTKQGFLRYLA